MVRAFDPNPDIRAPSPAPQLQTFVHLRAECPWRMIGRHGCREWRGDLPVRCRMTIATNSRSFRLPDVGVVNDF